MGSLVLNKFGNRAVAVRGLINVQCQRRINFILIIYMLDRSLQDFEFRSPYRWKSFERAPHPQHFNAKL